MKLNEQIEKETIKSGIELIRLDHTRKITNNKSC